MRMKNGLAASIYTETAQRDIHYGLKARADSHIGVFN